jgi:tetratricopeptide (TPR) repeat protein
VIYRRFFEHLARAEYLRSEGKLAEATEEILAALRLRPNHVGATFELGLLYFMQQRNEEAESYLATIVQRKPNHLEAHRLLGSVYMQLQDLEKAEKHVRQAIRLSQGTEAEDWSMLAMACMGQGKLNRAYLHCQKALKLDATSGLAHILKGLIFAVAGDLEAAEAILEGAASRGLHLGYLHYALGQIYAMKGYTAKARSEYLRAINSQDIPSTLAHRELVALTDDVQEQISYLEQIILCQPSDIASRKKLIRLYLKTRKLEDVPSEFQALARMLDMNKDGEALLLYGDYNALQGELRLALEAYREAASLIPKAPDPWYRMGEVLSLSEKEREAIDCFRKAIKLRRWADTNYVYEPLLDSDKIEENRDVARGDGIGPFDLLWGMLYYLFSNIWQWLRSRIPFYARRIHYVLIALVLSVAFEFWIFGNRAAFPADLPGALIRLASLTFIGMLLLITVHRLIRTPVILRPGTRQWLPILTLLSLPMGLFYVLTFPNVCGLAFVAGHILSIFLLAYFLSLQPLVPTRRTMVRLVLASTPFWVACVGLSVLLSWFTWRSLDISVALPSTVTEWIFIALAVYIAFVFSLALITGLWITFLLWKRRIGVESFRELIKKPAEKYRQLRSRFVEEWGFSGLYFDCLLPLLTAYILTSLAESVPHLKWLAYPSAILNYFIFMVLTVVFIDYAFSPRPIKRIRLDRLAGILDLGSRFSLGLPLAILITAALFGAYWLNYSLILTNFNLISPDAFSAPGNQTPVDSTEWSYVTFRLMVSGEFDIATHNFFAQMIIMVISISEFAFLSLFFTQIIRTLSLEENQNLQANRSGEDGKT